jgi:hypothetical protein
MAVPKSGDRITFQIARKDTRFELSANGLKTVIALLVTALIAFIIYVTKGHFW